MNNDSVKLLEDGGMIHIFIFELLSGALYPPSHRCILVGSKHGTYLQFGFKIKTKLH
jgi:hypothetical protein